MQAAVEAEFSKKNTTAKKRVSSHKIHGGGEVNHFFPGIRGDEFVAEEDRLLLHLQTEVPEHLYLVEGVPFCLPVDIKNEVRKWSCRVSNLCFRNFVPDNSFSPLQQ